MTGMLASVTSVAEALLVAELAVDIIDLKQPSSGALGALDTALVKQIVTVIKHRYPVSATIGDLPMNPEIIVSAVQTMAATGVDYVKIGFFPNGDIPATLTQLSPLIAEQNIALIAVLFADNKPDFALLALLKAAGFKGVMLDTMDKNNGSLTQVMSLECIQEFVTITRKLGLLCGLAGSLRQLDIAVLRMYQPDYLGFRGALCTDSNRVGELNQQAIVSLLNTIRN